MTGGSHQVHAKNQAFTCDFCHTLTAVNAAGGILDKSVHANGLLTWDLNEAKGQITAASTYMGSNAGETDTGTTVDYGSCDSIYCHSNVQTSPPGGALTYTTPTWGGSVVCGSCHLAGPVGAGAEQNTGSHLTHVSASEYQLSCNECHLGGGSGTTNHANYSIDVVINTGGTYNGTAAPGDAYSTCSSVNCHSDGKATPTYATPTWGATADCVFCHGGAGGSVGGAATSLTTSHTVHTNGAGFGFTCNNCHTTVTSDNTTIIDFNLHVNTARNVAIDAGVGGGSFAGNACSTTYCHGTISDDWTVGGTTGDCSLCHGMAANPADGRDTAGDTANTDPQVGAHVAHLTAASGISAAITCNQCHIEPAGATYEDRVKAIGHIDSALPADITWGNLADGNDDGQSPPTPAPISCATTYCHDGSKIKNGWSSASLAPVWNDPTFLNSPVTVADCDNCHGYPPGGGHTTITNCSLCHDNVNVDNLTFVTPSLHVNGVVEPPTGGDECSTCHSNANLSARHTVHSDPDTLLAGRTLSGGDWGNASWWFDYSNTGGTPLAACGQCHPDDEATYHTNGTVNLDLDPTNVNIPGGNIKTQNADPENYSQTEGTSVTCSSVYCHSNGYQANLVYQTTPDWYGGTFTGDVCSNCHGNSPNSGGTVGSPAHYNEFTRSDSTTVAKGHFVGIHYDNIYTGTGGLATAGNTGTSSHGNATTSTAISCNVCHNATVTVSANDDNTVCTTCHAGTPVGVVAIDAAATTHVNGQPDVAFDAVNARSKAQLRDASIPAEWDRSVSAVPYKTDGAFDEAVNALNTDDYTDQTCTVACHNDQPIQWNDAVSCNTCHKGL
jgi:predicted CxxxxCH...CXXCH cytochrome family protein